MRLWSIHPAILDKQGLGGVWFEGLRAQGVIYRLYKTFYIYSELVNLGVSLGTIEKIQTDGRRRRIGYLNHSQMTRFLATEQPLAAIGSYLSSIHVEAQSRGYAYDKGKILEPDSKVELTVTSGQLEYEHRHILTKLKERSPEDYRYFADSKPMPGAMFRVVSGEIESWEHVKS